MPTVFGTVGQEVIRPDMIFVFRSMTDTAVNAATGNPSSFSLFSRDLHLFLLPQTMDAFAIHRPTFLGQFVVNTWTSVPGITRRNPPHLLQQRLVPARLFAVVSLGGTRLAEHSASSSFRYAIRPQTTTDCPYRTPPTFGVYQFPLAASLRISMSKACSATIFLSRAFSF